MSDFLSFEMVFFDASRVFQGYILGYVSPGGLITAQFGIASATLALIWLMTAQGDWEL